MAEDYVDQILRQWMRERPDLDVGPMGILGRLSRLTRHLDRSIEETFQRYGLGIGTFNVLAALRRTGKPYRLSPSDLYTARYCSRPARTGSTGSKQGLVMRVPDPADRRGILVVLTPKGKKNIDTAVTEHMEKPQGLLIDLSHSQQKELAALLRTLLLRFDSPKRAPQELDLGKTGVLAPVTSPEAPGASHIIYTSLRA